MLIVALLSAGFALPSNAVKGIERKVREEMAATRSLTSSIQNLPATRAAVDFQKSGLGTTNVTAINASSKGRDSEIVVTLDNSVQYESARLSSPDRIYFDLHNARLASSVGPKTVPTEDGLLKWVRAAQNSDDVVRLVLDADGANDFSAKLLTEPYRLLIEVHAQTADTLKNEANSTTSLDNGSPTAPRNGHSQRGQQSLARELGLKISRIAIDPGHGGYDTGATGPHGLLEKELCLDVALRLGQLIEQNIPGAQVIYTRKDDRHVPLEERTAIANDADADLFLSIHANSSDSREIRGAKLYYVNLATNKESRDLAMRENALGESSLHNLPELLKKIARNEKMAESKQFAADIQSSLSQRLQLVSRQETNRGVKQAPFIVLTGANMPAVLSEISFLSNASDEDLLLESSQRQRVAEGLYRGVTTYLESLQGVTGPKQKLVTENHSRGVAGSK